MFTGNLKPRVRTGRKQRGRNCRAFRGRCTRPDLASAFVCSTRRGSVTVLLDYGIGNLRSLERAFERAGVPVLRSGRVEDARAAERLVLPGVGAFGACAAALRAHGLDRLVADRARAGVPLLGVCVGMQLLFDRSDESDPSAGSGRAAAGLSLLPGAVVRFAPDATGPDGRRLKVPHMGWNALDVQQSHPAVAGLGNAPYVYFVHSYHAVPSDRGCVVATAEYGGPVPAVVAAGSVVGVQFHPEKSGPVGLALLRAWDAATAVVPSTAD